MDREEINAEINRLMAELNDLQQNVDYGEPGIYYECVRESQSIERRIQDLIHELEEIGIEVITDAVENDNDKGVC